MKYLLDTNICIYLLKGTSPALVAHVQQAGQGALCISAITWVELWHGVVRSAHRQRSARLLEVFSKNVDVLAFDQEAAFATGEVVANLRQAGTPIGAYDALIAGHALSLHYPLVTHNVREFRRVKGLKIEDWLSD